MKLSASRMTQVHGLVIADAAAKPVLLIPASIPNVNLSLVHQ